MRRGKKFVKSTNPSKVFRIFLAVDWNKFYGAIFTMALKQKSCAACGSSFFTAKGLRNCPMCRSVANYRAKQRRLRREFDAPGEHTEQEWQHKLSEYKHCCYWCDRYLYAPNGCFVGTKDHLTPLSRRGTNYIANIVPCCKVCNSRKGRRTRREYEQKISATSTVPASSFAEILQDQLTFEPWPEPSRPVARMIAKLAVSKQMEESILPFSGFDVFAKKSAMQERRQLLRNQALSWRKA